MQNAQIKMLGLYDFFSGNDENYTTSNDSNDSSWDHGYDDTSPDPNGYEEGACPDMRAVFFARGPGFRNDGHRADWIKLVDEYQVEQLFLFPHRTYT